MFDDPLIRFAVISGAFQNFITLQLDLLSIANVQVTTVLLPSSFDWFSVDFKA